MLGAAAALTAVVGGVLLVHGSGNTATEASVTVEATDTDQGVVGMVHGSGFAADGLVQLYWVHPGHDDVTARASSTGVIDATVPMPGAHEASMADDTGTFNLIATDGAQMAKYAVAVAPPSGVVLGAQATSRVTVGGAPYFLLGANYPWVHYGNDFGSNAWGSYGVHSGGSYASDFADMKAKGVHVVRWWVFADGRAGIDFAADGTPIGLQPSVYADLNAALALARQNNIYLDLVLFDFSFLNTPTTAGGVQLGGHSDVIKDATKRAALINNVIRPLAQAYGQEPMIAAWELMNEPEWAISNLPQPAVNGYSQPATMQQFWSYASAVSQIVHFYTTSNVTVGSASLKWNKVWTNAFAMSQGLPVLNLDFYQTHYYPWMDCCTINDPVLGKTTMSPLTQLVSGLNLDKPIVVGEISTPSGSAGTLLDTILNNGYGGFWGWSYNSAHTGDKLAIDWATFTPWEEAHAAIVRIPPPASAPTASPTATPTVTQIATATPTQTAVAVATSTPVVPAATSTATATARPRGPKPRGFATPTPTATPSNTPMATTTSSSTPTATNVASATPTPTPTRTPTPTAALPNTPTPTPTAGQSVPLVFGVTNTVGVNDSTDMGYLNGSPVSLSATGALSSLSVYVGQVATGSKVRLGLYAGGSPGNPGNLIAQTGEAAAVMGWNTLQIPSGPPLAPGMYWIAAQTNAPTTVYRMATAAAPSNATAWYPHAYGAFPASTGTWTMQSGPAFSMAGTVMTVPANEGATPIATPTATSTPAPASTPAPTATPTTDVAPTPTMGSGSFDAACAAKLNPKGVTQCGDPRYFCDTWAGGSCNDYRTKQTTMESAFPQTSDAVSLDCLSSTNAGQTSWLPYYVPTNNSDNTDVPGYELIPSPCGISMYEHFMTRMEDGQFGMVVMRQQRPFDFAGRTGHMHFDIDLKTLERRYVRLTLSPNLTKIGVDDRNSVPQATSAFDLWFRNGTFQGKLSQGGTLTDLFPACNGCGARYYGQDNVRDHVDVYVSRTHVKVTVNGVTQVDQDVADLGFDRAYMYLQHVNYNSCKAYAVEGYATIAECQLAGNTFHWDNVAFDGPTLPVNGLTPAGSEDVVFNVWSAASCSVRGVAAQGSGRDYVWQTWVARLPAGTPVSPSDVVCTGGGNPGWYHYDGVPMGFEVVQQGG